MRSTEGCGDWLLRTRRIALLACLSASQLLPANLLSAQAPPPPPPPAQPDLPSLPAPPPTPAAQPAFSVVIDAAHGGSDMGARISPDAPEKDLVLSLAGRLHAALDAKGIPVILTRESDVNMAAVQRASITNHALASACLLLHATATGVGVHLYTSSLPPAASSNAVPALLPWQSAQAAWITRSLRLSSELNSALGHAQIPTTLGVASIKPLDNLNCPAVALEVSPLAASARDKAALPTDQTYQQRIVDAMVSALLEWRTDWKQQP